MNEPNESEFEISVPEAPAQDAPAPEAPGPVTYVLPEGYLTAKAPEPQSPVEEPPPEEPEIVRHDPFAYMRGAPWMNRRLSPSGRAAAFARRELKAFPVIEGRDPNHADLDAIVKRTVDYMVPIFKRERATDIAYDELEKRRAARIAEKQRVAQAAATASPASGGGSIAGAALKETAKRVAPFLATAPAGVLAPAIAAAVLLRPSTSEKGSYDLGDDLRFRVPPGSLQGEIERRIGGRWERVGTAELNSGAGPRLLVESTTAFANAVGAQMAGRLVSQGIVGKRPSRGSGGSTFGSAIRWAAPGDLASLEALGPGTDRLPIAELRMLTKDKAGPRYGDVAREKVEEFCPNYPRIQAIATEAGRMARAEGPTNHLQYGQRTHTGVTQAIRDAAAMRELLERQGIQEIRADLAIFGGETIRFRNVRGTAIIDVVERMISGDVCIYDVKTGGARFPDAKMEQYADEFAEYLRARSKPFGKIYVLPVYVEDMFGRDHNRK